MKKSKKFIGSVLVCCMLLCSLCVMASAAYHSYTSSLDFGTNLIGSSRTYKYPDVGFKYKDALCTYQNGAPVTTARFYTSLRMGTGLLGAWQDIGRAQCVVNANPDFYLGWTFESAQEANTTHKGYFAFSASAYETQSRPTTCDHFVMYSQT